MDEQWFAQRNPDVASPVKAGNLPGVSGLYVATVKQVQADPANEYRVEVQVPTLANTVWARLAQPYATSAAGSFFYPEVNDEVILAYFGDDPRYPVVLGALYSSARAPAYTPDEKNPKKAITTAAGLVLEFDDKQKILTLKTPGDADSKKPNQLVISDAGKSITLTDQQQNSVTLSASGITLDSKSAVNIRAANDITLESTGGNVTIKAAQALSASGTEASVKGSEALSLTATGTGELSVDAMLTIKGLLVAIN